jgi:hypothetical protein
MAIRVMVSKERAEELLAAGSKKIEIVRDYPGAEEGRIYHDYDNCPIRQEEKKTGFIVGNPIAVMIGCTSNCRPGGPLYMETSHEGLVLSLRERNGYEDSDFYARVWDPIKKTTNEVTYATTRGWSYPNNAWVDATPEVLAEYEEYKTKRDEALARAADKCRKDEAALRFAQELLMPKLGRRVVVFKGRKVPVGTEGVVIWEGDGQWGTRIGIKRDDGGLEWTAASNAKVIAPDADALLDVVQIALSTIASEKEINDLKLCHLMASVGIPW